MSKILNYGLLYAMLACFLFSCSQAGFEDIKSNAEQESNAEKGSFNFVYHGKYYSGTYQTTGATTEYSDENVRVIMDSLKEKPNLAIFIHEGGLIEYFDDKDDLDANLVLKFSTTRTDITDITKRLNKYDVTMGRLVVYDDSNLKGKQAAFVIDKSNGFNCEISDLGNYGLNDKISSITLECGYITRPPVPFDDYPVGKNICEVTFYSDCYFEGYTVSFIVHPEYAWSEIHYFSSVTPYGPHFDKNWNDRAGSLKFKTVYYSPQFQ